MYCYLKIKYSINFEVLELDMQKWYSSQSHYVVKSLIFTTIIMW